MASVTWLLLSIGYVCLGGVCATWRAEHDIPDYPQHDLVAMTVIALWPLWFFARSCNHLGRRRR